MDKHIGFMILIMFAQVVTLAWVIGIAHELRLLSSVVERIKVWTAKR